MNRKKDLEWYLARRESLSTEYQGRWIVIFDQKVVKAFNREEEAVEFSVIEYGINEASVFQATKNDPYIFA